MILALSMVVLPRLKAWRYLGIAVLEGTRPAQISVQMLLGPHRRRVRSDDFWHLGSQSQVRGRDRASLGWSCLILFCSHFLAPGYADLALCVVLGAYSSTNFLVGGDSPFQERRSCRYDREVHCGPIRR